MTMFYSATKKGFYSDFIRKQYGANWPEDAVELTDAEHKAYSTFPPDGMVLGASSNGKPAWVAFPLVKVRGEKLARLFTAYVAATEAPITFTASGAAATLFQADTHAQANIQRTLLIYSVMGNVPDAFYWVAADNTQLPFTLKDLEGLGSAIMDRGWTAFQKLQTLKTQVRAAATASAVNAITW